MRVTLELPDTQAKDLQKYQLGLILVLTLLPPAHANNEPYADPEAPQNAAYEYTLDNHKKPPVPSGLIELRPMKPQPIKKKVCCAT